MNSTAKYDLLFRWFKRYDACVSVMWWCDVTKVNIGNQIKNKVSIILGNINVVMYITKKLDIFNTL